MIIPGIGTRGEAFRCAAPFPGPRPVVHDIGRVFLLRQLERLPGMPLEHPDRTVIVTRMIPGHGVGDVQVHLLAFLRQPELLAEGGYHGGVVPVEGVGERLLMLLAVVLKGFQELRFTDRDLHVIPFVYLPVSTYARRESNSHDLAGHAGLSRTRIPFRHERLKGSQWSARALLPHLAGMHGAVAVTCAGHDFELMRGVEPPYSAWEAETLAVVLHQHDPGKSK